MRVREGRRGPPPRRRLPRFSRRLKAHARDLLPTRVPHAASCGSAPTAVRLRPSSAAPDRATCLRACGRSMECLWMSAHDPTRWRLPERTPSPRSVRPDGWNRDRARSSRAHSRRKPPAPTRWTPSPTAPPREWRSASTSCLQRSACEELHDLRGAHQLVSMRTEDRNTHVTRSRISFRRTGEGNAIFAHPRIWHARRRSSLRNRRTCRRH